MRKSILWGSFVLAAFATGMLGRSQQARAEILLSLDHGSQNIYRIDTAQLGSPVLVGHVDTGTDLWELRRASPGLLYTFDRDANTIITISQTDAHTINVTNLDQDLFVSRRGFDFSPGGVLYGVLPGMQLRTVNPATGVSTLIANITGAARVEALAFAPDGRLFASGSAGDDANSENLYLLNPTTGVLTLAGATGLPDIDTLAFGFDGQLYGANSVDGTPAHLRRFNLVSGIATDLGDSGVPGFNGLVAIPEPSTLAAVGLAAILWALFPRRQRGRSARFTDGLGGHGLRGQDPVPFNFIAEIAEALKGSGIECEMQ